MTWVESSFIFLRMWSSHAVRRAAIEPALIGVPPGVRVATFAFAVTG